MSNKREYLVDVTSLISLPDIYIAIREAVDDPEVGMVEVADIISFDPAMSTRLLKMANSPFYGQVAKIDTINRAVMLLGAKTVHDTVLAISISQAFQSVSSVNFDVSSFWRGSIMRAVVAKSCANELNVPEPERLFLLGLLSDIGHMIMGIRAPDLMLDVWNQHQKTGHPIHLYERSTFGFDYGELGADILEGWSIPQSIVNGIRYQNCPEIAQEYKQEAAIVYCAGRLHPNEDTFPEMIDVEALEQSGLAHFDYDHVRQEAQELYGEALNLLQPPKLKQAS